ncbi:MAG: Uma2 family endonuclease [Gammaproteobacteria bacterium]
MAIPAPIAKMSADEYLAWEGQRQDKNEFIQGEVYAMVGVTRQRATVAGNLFVFLKQALRGTPCRAYMADMKLRVEAADAFFYPDVFVTCSEADHAAVQYLTEPRLIVEVLSDSTEAFDRGAKFEHYRRIPTRPCMPFGMEMSGSPAVSWLRP